VPTHELEWVSAMDFCTAAAVGRCKPRRHPKRCKCFVLCPQFSARALAFDISHFDCRKQSDMGGKGVRVLQERLAIVTQPPVYSDDFFGSFPFFSRRLARGSGIIPIRSFVGLIQNVMLAHNPTTEFEFRHVIDGINHSNYKNLSNSMCTLARTINADAVVSPLGGSMVRKIENIRMELSSAGSLKFSHKSSIREPQCIPLECAAVAGAPRSVFPMILYTSQEYDTLGPESLEDLLPFISSNTRTHLSCKLHQRLGLPNSGSRIDITYWEHSHQLGQSDLGTMYVEYDFGAPTPNSSTSHDDVALLEMYIKIVNTLGCPNPYQGRNGVESIVSSYNKARDNTSRVPGQCGN
jgi:hypothetical protein